MKNCNNVTAYFSTEQLLQLSFWTTNPYHAEIFLYNHGDQRVLFNLKNIINSESLSVSCKS